MGTATAIVKQVYEAFGRGDVPTILNLVADEVVWELVGPTNLPYAGRRKNHKEVADFFAAVAHSDDIHAFEPREFIEANEHMWSNSIDLCKRPEIHGVRPNAVHLTVRGELVEPPASQLEPFDKLRANGIFLK